MSLLRIVDSAREDAIGLLRKRLHSHATGVEEAVAKIIADVRQRGDAALLEGARRFDCPHLESILVTELEWESAGEGLTEFHAEAIRAALKRVTDFHLSQKARLDLAYPEGRWTLQGQNVGQRLLVLESAGIYVPGGLAFYPSSVVMNVGPARAAGVPRIVVTTPSSKRGVLHPGILFALRELDVTEVIKAGGAYAIAALALGTESITPVDKIAGPGNRFVNEAKRQLWGAVGLDGYAGSSEVCVLADETANPVFAAADLLTQVEHAEDNAGFLVTLSPGKLDQILAEAERQIAGAPREATLRKALADFGMAFVARNMSEALDLVNLIAPEHLTVAVEDPEPLLPHIKNAGCVLLGEYTPESAGDFAIGPSHTLPTSGAARFGSPVNVLDFVKVQSVSMLSKDDLANLAPIVEAFGEMEGFPAHAFGTTVRFQGL